MKYQHQGGPKSPSLLHHGFIRLVATALLLTATIAPAHADEAEVDQQIETLLGSADMFRETIADLQQRIANEDTIAVSAFISYPITVKVDGRSKTLRQAEDLEPAYDEIFTPEIIDVIVNQDYGSLFVNSDGVMFGDGEIWMSAICIDDGCEETEVKIITIQSAD